MVLKLWERVGDYSSKVGFIIDYSINMVRGLHMSKTEGHYSHDGRIRTIEM